MQSHFRFLRWALLLSAALVFSACGDGSSSSAKVDEEEDLDEEAFSIDDGASEGIEAKVWMTASKGGTISVKSGAQVTIDPGALAKDLEIGMARPSDKEAAKLVKGIPSQKLASAPYVLTPHGTQFKTSAQVKLPVDAKSAGKRVKVQWLEDESDTQWKELAEAKVEAGKAAVKVKHFSVLVLVVMDAGEELPAWDDADQEDTQGGDGDGDVVACGPGRYDAQDGSKAPCKACPAGTYNEHERAMSCLSHATCALGVLKPGTAVLDTLCAGETMLSLAAGDDHTCAVSNLGVVKCWGSNGFGESGVRDQEVVLATAVPLAGPAREVAASEMHSCAALFDGRVACWGGAEGGQLAGIAGRGGAEPVYVPGVSNAVAVALHAYGSCAVLADASVTCWGMDVRAREIARPQQVAELENITQGVGGKRHLCFLDQAGTVWCAGDNESGQLGVGPNEFEVSGFRAVGLPGSALELAAGDKHTCARLTSGELACWGDNSWGAVGAGESAVFYPTLVSLPAAVERVFAGGSTTCATTSEALYCWGKNEFGEARVAGMRQLVAPQQVGNAVRLATLGASHGCALQSDERIACWGSRERNQTNEAPREVLTQPTLVASSVSHVAMGASTLCTQEEGKGTALCRGTLPQGSVAEPSYATWAMFPTAVQRPEFNASLTAISDDWGCAKDAESERLTCWGIGLNASAPNEAAEVGFSLPHRIADVQLFGAYGCAIGSELAAPGAVQNAYCFGKSNANGQLGNDSNLASLTPVPVSVDGLTETEITALAVGERHACLSAHSGAVYCWGRGGDFEHGQSEQSDLSQGKRVPLEGAAIDLAAGRSFSCALLQPVLLGGPMDVFCWGKNDFGQVDPASAIPALSPTAAIEPGTYNHLVAGDEHACVFDREGLVWCWGRSTFGQAGVLADRTELRQIELSEPAAALFAKGHTTCALTAGLDLYCWGKNASGMLGGSHPYGSDEAVFSL